MKRGRYSIWTLALLGVVANAAAGADLFTVGPGGSHATIQDAIDAAGTTPVDDEIRLSPGVFVAQLSIPDAVTGGLSISGGWQSGFTVQRSHPRATSIDANGVDRTLRVECSSLAFELSNLRITGGRTGPSGATSGGGVLVRASNRCEIDFVDLVGREGSAPPNYSPGPRRSSRPVLLLSRLSQRFALAAGEGLGIEDRLEGPPQRIAPSPSAAGHRVRGSELQFDVGQSGSQHPEMAVERTSIEHLDQSLYIVAVEEEPEPVSSVMGDPTPVPDAPALVRYDEVTRY